MRIEITYPTESEVRCIPVTASASTNWTAVREMARIDGALDMEDVERQISEAKAVSA